MLCCSSMHRAEVFKPCDAFSFLVEQEIFQVVMKRATEKQDNSASVWEFSCIRESLECELHSV